MPHRRTLFTAAGAVLLLAGRGPASAAEPGVGAKRILFGQAAVLEGAAAALGRGMRDGIAAAFAEANRAGGVKGRMLELLSRDDGYEPAQSERVTRALVEQEGVFALIGAVGTPTAQAAQPVAADAELPFIAPFTGAEYLREPRLGNVVNFRASYFQETEVMVARVTEDLGAKRIALLYQDDAFGRAGLQGVRLALERRGLRLAAEGSYERNTTAVQGALRSIQRGQPEAVLMVGAYRPCAAFIRLARQSGLDATFVNISFVGSEALAQELGGEGKGVVVTQVVPFPHDAAQPLARHYQAALRARDPAAKPGFVSFEGYIAGRLAIAALERVRGEPTRQGFLDAVFKGAPFDIDGLKLTFGPEDNQGSDSVWLTVLGADGAYHPVTRLGAPVG